jgi:hypothetical protein
MNDPPATKGTRENPPKSIRRFAGLYWASAAVSIGNIFLNYAALRAYAVARQSSPAGPILAVVITTVTALIFWFVITRRASNVGKWVLIVFSVFDLIQLPRLIDYVLAIGPLYGVLNGLSLLLLLGALVMLFRRDAVIWLKSGGKLSPANPSVFD